MIGLKKQKAFSPATDRLFSAIPGIEHASGVPVLHADKLREDVFIKNWVNRNRACLIKGAVAHWPAVRKWKQKSYWLSRLDNFEVDVFPHENFMTPDMQNNGREVMYVQLGMLNHDSFSTQPSTWDRFGPVAPPFPRIRAFFNSIHVTSHP